MLGQHNQSIQYTFPQIILHLAPQATDRVLHDPTKLCKIKGHFPFATVYIFFPKKKKYPIDSRKSMHVD